MEDGHANLTSTSVAPTITLMAESHETRRRRRIEERLSRLIGEGAAAFYHDALEIPMADQLKSRGHLLGHLIRETDSALFQAMSPLVGLPPPRERATSRNGRGRARSAAADR